jgi:hypothetical protein
MLNTVIGSHFINIISELEVAELAYLTEKSQPSGRDTAPLSFSLLFVMG